MKLSKEARFRLAVKSAMLAGFAAGPQGVVLAQDTPNTPTTAPAAAGAPIELDTIEVTGSRLPQPNLTSTSSMTIINDTELDLQGTVSVETLINTMPQAFAEFSTNDSNGATGTATVNLRGLGSARTLVLIDGKRLMPGDPLLSPPSPDLNFIPAPLVESVEILSGGASAVYGSDAVAGVVNFIMKRDFEGFRLDTQISRTFEGDGMTRDYFALFGTNFANGSGNVTAYAGYTRQNAITQDQRDFSACSITTPASGDTHICAGSRTIAEGLFYSYDRAAAGLDYYSIVNPNGTRTFIEDDGRTFNFAPFNYFQRPSERYTLGGFAHREVNEHLGFYGSVMFMDNRTTAAVAPSGLFFVPATIPCNSPLLSDQQEDILCTQPNAVFTTDDDPETVAIEEASVLVAKRTVEIGPRLNDLRHTDYRINVGVDGDIINGITYDVSVQRGEVIYQAGQLNYINTANAQAALNTTVDGEGNAVCVDGGDCVPLDIFQLGGINAEQADFISSNGFEQANMIEEIATAVVTADLGRYGVRIPSASSGIALAVGTEYRRETLDYRPDTLVETGNLGGFGGPRAPVAGEFRVREWFTELRLPIVEDKPGADVLQLDGAYRRSDYTTAGETDSYKVGLQWAPVKDVTLRASYQSATRAPSITELFSPAGLGLFAGADPCSRANLRIPTPDPNDDPGNTIPNPNAPTLEQCQNTGVTEAQYNAGLNGTPGSIPDCSSGQCNALFGGNAALDVEESTTRSYGIVFTPTFIKDLSVTIDFFDIEVEDAIAFLPPTVTLQQCLVTGSAALCDLINRSPGNGALFGDPSNPNVGFIQANNANLSSFSTSGIDIEAAYAVNIGTMGRLSFNYVTTLLESLEVEVAEGLGQYDCAGLYGTTCGTPSPEYRHKLRTTWTLPFGLAMSAQWRYFGEAELDANQSDPNLDDGDGNFNAIDNTLDGKHYLDIAGIYTLPKFTDVASLAVRFGVNNIGDTEPQVVSSNNPNPVSSPPFGNGNTFPNVYDVLGPQWFVGLQADF